MNAQSAYKLSLSSTAIAFISTIISWFLMNCFGRWSSYIGSMLVIFICLMLIGILGIPTKAKVNGVVWGQASLCIIWLFTFSLTIGPIGWTIPAEVSSTRLRSKTICLARNAYYLAIIGANALEPYMMNPTAFNWKGYTGFFWAGFAFLTLVWAYFRLPETKNRTFEELDIMFAARVPTRKFSVFHVDAYAEDLDITDRVQGSISDKVASTA